MPAKKQSKTKTPANRSKKAHMPRPPKTIAGHPDTDQAPGRDVGQYSGAGTPALEKK